MTSSQLLPKSSGPMKAFQIPQMLSSNSDTVKFYDRFDDYYEFTNFYHHPVRIDGFMWPTTEHYFQAQKFVGTPYYNHIRKLSFPRDAFKISRDPVVSRWVRGDWNSVKDDVMLKALRVKFEDPTLKHKLLSTKSKKLVEHTANDSYWGDGGNGRGMNKLGELLMRVRDELMSSESKEKQQRENRVSGFSLKRSNSFSNLRELSKPSGIGAREKPVGVRTGERLCVTPGASRKKPMSRSVDSDYKRLEQEKDLTKLQRSPISSSRGTSACENSFKHHLTVGSFGTPSLSRTSSFSRSVDSDKRLEIAHEKDSIKLRKHHFSPQDTSAGPFRTHREKPFSSHTLSTSHFYGRNYNIITHQPLYPFKK